MSSYLKTIAVVSFAAYFTTKAIKKAMEITGDKDVAQKLVQKGDSAHKAKKWDDAISYYTMAIKLDANNANSYMKRAESYLESKSYNKAKEDCNSAIGLDEKCARAYSLRGKAHQLLGCGKEANEDLKRAQELDKSKQMKKRAHPKQNAVYTANRSSTFTIAGPILIQNMNIIFYNRRTNM